MYSGVRALWDSQQKVFQLRNGMKIQPPAKFAELLSPTNNDNIRLDGVLWLGYGKQDELARRLAKNSQHEDLWRDMQYLVYDIPNHYDLDERLTMLKSLSFKTGMFSLLYKAHCRFSCEAS